MGAEKENAELPYQQFHEMYGGTFRAIIYKALLEALTEELQANYRVTGCAQMPDDKWVIRLTRRLVSDL